MAGAVDLVIGMGPVVIALLLTDSFGAWRTPDDLLWIEHASQTFHLGRARLAWTWLACWMPFAFLHGVCGALQRSTPGATLMRLRVVGPDGHPPTAIRGTVRGIAYMTWPLTLFLAPLLSLVSRDQQGVHDWLSGTWVVAVPARPNTPV